MTTFVSLD